MTGTVNKEIEFNSSVVIKSLLASVLLGVISSVGLNLLTAPHTNIYVSIAVFAIWPVMFSLCLYATYQEYTEQEAAKFAVSRPTSEWKHRSNELGKSDIFVVCRGIECDVSNDECLGFATDNPNTLIGQRDDNHKFAMRNTSTGWFYVVTIESYYDMTAGITDNIKYSVSVTVPYLRDHMHDDIGSFDIDLWRQVSPKIPTEDFNTSERRDQTIIDNTVEEMDFDVA